MEKNNRDDSVQKGRQEAQRNDEFQGRGSLGTNNDSSNEPYVADGDTTIRKKDPNNSPDWRESEEPNPSRETSGWQKSNDWDDTIREPEGTITTGERENVINSATWDPGSHTSEEDVAHVDVNDYVQPNQKQIKPHEDRLEVDKDRK
jgi:hypothetical protein